MVGGILLFALALSFASAQIDLPPSGYRFTSEGTDDYVLDLATPLGVSATDIDAAFQRRANGRIYLVKGLDVWSLPDPVYTALGVQNDLGGVNPPRFSIYEYWPNLATSLPSPITKIDDFLEAIDGTLYIFAGNYVFQYKDDLVVGSLSEDDVTISPMEQPRSNSWSEYKPPRRIAHVFTDLPGSIDASVQLNNGFFYFFKGASYYRAPDRSIYGPTRTTEELVEPSRVEGCYPKAISAGWDITKPITAAFRSISSRNLVFIHADGTTTTIKEKYLDTAPHKEVEYLASAPLTDNITVSCVNQTALDPAVAAALTGAYDAIFQRRNGKIYIFIGDMYYRLTDRTHTPYPWDCLDEGYPKLITDSFDFPAGVDFTANPIDAAFQRSNGKLYFFFGTGYFRFSDKYLDDASDFSGKDLLDYGASLANFGFLVDPTLGGTNPISSVYQKVNGKIYFIFEDNTVYRLDDKYLTTGANDHIDEQYEAGTVTFLDEFYTAPWDLATGPIRNVYQRVETSQKIHVLGGAADGAVQNEALYFDQTLQWIQPCTACKKDPLATD